MVEKRGRLSEPGASISQALRLGTDSTGGRQEGDGAVGGQGSRATWASGTPTTLVGPELGPFEDLQPYPQGDGRLGRSREWLGKQ